MATDAEVKAAGYTLPAGSDQIRLGDDAIRANAHAAYTGIKTHRHAATDLTDANRLPLYRSTLSPGENWNDLKRTGTYGWIQADLSTYAGELPPGVSGQGIIEVLMGRTEWTLIQRAVEAGTNRTYVRSMQHPGTTPPRWWPWERLPLMSDMRVDPAGVGLLSGDWLHVGDSQTDDLVLGAGQWGNVLATLDGRDHEISGWFAQRAAGIAARMGAALYPVTIPGGTIPAAGTITVQGKWTQQLAFGGYASLRTRQVPGWLEGRHGYLLNPDNSATEMTFTPDDGAATATPVSGLAHFQGDLTPYTDRIITIQAGGNDRADQPPARLVGVIRSMLRSLPGAGRALVLSVVPYGDGSYSAETDAINAAYAAAFPGEYFDVFAAITTEQAAIDAGITWTQQDRDEIAAGQMPGSLRRDHVHLNSSGARALAHAIHREAVARGWSVDSSL